MELAVRAALSAREGGGGGGVALTITAEKVLTSLSIFVPYKDLTVF
jgi:hypothetical protein